MDELEFFNGMKTDDERTDEFVASAEHFVRLKKQTGLQKDPFEELQKEAGVREFAQGAKAGLKYTAGGAFGMAHGVKHPNTRHHSVGFLAGQAAPAAAAGAAGYAMGHHEKKAYEIQPSDRPDIPRGDFAQPSKEEAGHKGKYPIPDRQHARSALGFAKMHHDSAAYAAVKAKVEKKFPGMVGNGEEKDSCYKMASVGEALGEIGGKMKNYLKERPSLRAAAIGAGAMGGYGAMRGATDNPGHRAHGALSGAAEGALAGGTTGALAHHLGTKIAGVGTTQEGDKLAYEQSDLRENNEGSPMDERLSNAAQKMRARFQEKLAFDPSAAALGAAAGGFIGHGSGALTGKALDKYPGQSREKGTRAGALTGGVIGALGNNKVLDSAHALRSTHHVLNRFKASPLDKIQSYAGVSKRIAKKFWPEALAGSAAAAVLARRKGSHMDKEANALVDRVKNIDPTLLAAMGIGAGVGGIGTYLASRPHGEEGKSRAEEELEAAVEAQHNKPEGGLLSKMHGRNTELQHGYAQAFRDHPVKAGLLGALTGAAGGYSLGKIVGLGKHMGGK